ncbi:hypothetical protein BHM03_00020335, partial [Ensete ventricosum]
TFTQHRVEDILQVLIVFCVESLELDFALLFPERHMLLRVLPVLVVLATSSEKESESLYKRVKFNRLINIFKTLKLACYIDPFCDLLWQSDPVIPAFPDLHLSPAAIMKELSMYFQSFSSQTRLLTLPGPHEIPPRELQEYPIHKFIFVLFFYIAKIWLVMGDEEEKERREVKEEEEEEKKRKRKVCSGQRGGSGGGRQQWQLVGLYAYGKRTTAMTHRTSHIVVLKSTDGADTEWSREVKGNMYDLVVEGCQLLSRWTGRIWEQCAWKFSRPCKEPASVGSHQSSTTFFDYEKVILCFFSFYFHQWCSILL